MTSVARAAASVPVIPTGRPVNGASLLRRFPYTAAAFACALAIMTAAVFWEIDVFELGSFSIIGIERSEVGEIVIAFLLVIPAFFVDHVLERQRMHESQLQAEQLRVVRVTMRTVQDIVNNNLNQLQLLRMEADGLVSGDTLILFDKALSDTAAQLTALGDLTVFVEKPMVSGAGLDAGT